MVKAKRFGADLDAIIVAIKLRWKEIRNDFGALTFHREALNVSLAWFATPGATRQTAQQTIA